MQPTPPPSTVTDRHTITYPPALQWAIGCVGTALLYFLTARASLYLAIPPGYSTPVWPAAAVAMVVLLRAGVTYAPGVLLGSLSLNLYVNHINGLPVTWNTPSLVAFSIALGATVQAWLSVKLVQRFVRLTHDPGRTGELVLIAILGGPVGALVNATWGTGSLLLGGAISISAFPRNWVTWWVGDSLGVFCFAPLLLTLVGGKAISVRRKLIVTLTHVVVLGVVIFSVWLLKRTEQRRLEARFEDDVTELQTRLHGVFASHGRVLESLEHLHVASTRVEHKEFAAFADNYVGGESGIHGVAWLAMVTEPHRTAFETALRDDGVAHFAIKDRAPGGTGFVSASTRDLYFPLTFAAPADLSAPQALGFDVFTEPRHRDALREAGNAKHSILRTSGPNLVPDDPRPSTLVYRPVYKRAANAPSALEGFVVGIFVMDELMASTNYLALERNLNLELVDPAATGHHTPLFVQDEHRATSTRRFARSAQLAVDAFGTPWRLTVTENELAVASNDGTLVWISLIAGCLFCGLLNIYLFSVTGRAELVQRLVDEKTLELRKNTLELATSNQRLENLAVAAEAANVAKSQFLAAMSHEIRTPMNGLVGAIQLLEGHVSGEQAELLVTAKQSAHSLLVLIDDILDLSKIEAGKMELVEEPLDVVRLVEEVCQLHAASCVARRLELRCLVAPGAAHYMLGDGQRVKQVLSNLVGNAIKFTTAGHVAVSCVRQVTQNGEHFEFSVADTGIGIKDDARATLFESFTQADASTTRHFGGSGLGLSICRKFVAMMGGEITMTSRVGEGSRFSFVVPQASPSAAIAAYQSDILEGQHVVVVDGEQETRQHLIHWLEHWGARVTDSSTPSDGDAADATYTFTRLEPPVTDAPAVEVIAHVRGTTSAGSEVTPVTPRRETLKLPWRLETLMKRVLGSNADGELTPTPSQRLSACRILVVDDNPTNLMIARKLLTRMKATPDIACNGREALSKLATESYDVILMDCMMPEMDGYQATTALRRGDAGNRNKGTPVVALTANALATDRQLCLDSGMSDYLTKPLRADQLGAALERWHGRRHVVQHRVGEASGGASRLREEQAT